MKVVEFIRKYARKSDKSRFSHFCPICSTLTFSSSYFLPLIFFLFLLFSCSTTKKLTEDEVLYVGVKKMKIEAPQKVKLNSTQNSAASGQLSVKPNNPLYSPYVRSPFPIGLWIYNWNIKKEKGFKWWLYRKLAKKPVLISDVQPELRLKMVDNAMKDFGFYGTTSRYEIIPHKRNPKKPASAIGSICLSLFITVMYSCGDGILRWIVSCARICGSPN